jgi:hypothetical protein
MKGLLQFKRGICILLIVALWSTVLIPIKPAQAASKYIKVNSFIKLLVQGIGLEVDTTCDEPHIEAIMAAGFIDSNYFEDYNSYITRTDAAVLLNKADEYLYGNTVNDKLLDTILNKRISDIKKIPKSKREAVAKIYGKGIIKGYSNGYYVQSREFRGSKYLTTSGANTVIDLILNPDKRAGISPDGQLIRTTNLPKNADKFEYILATYPNEFYERKFDFMFRSDFKDGTIPSDDYSFPVDVYNRKFITYYGQWPLKEELDNNLYYWAKMGEDYLNLIFNVDYKTVNNKWCTDLTSLFSPPMYSSNNAGSIEHLNYYVNKVKKNNVVIKSSIIVIEPSILYYDGDYCMRAYVRYEITANNINVNQHELVYGELLDLHNIKNGEWREGIFDIRFNPKDYFNGDSSTYGIFTLTRFSDSYNIKD